ncbi:MAG TPA: hypothetical protein VN951_02370 [Pyrinomonadaceae bacterium]|nr:hypothetical protein [Pyrinomonadaceae bacterium]
MLYAKEITMIFGDHFQDPKAMIRIAMVCFLLASLSRWFLHPATGRLGDLVDGVTGLLYGIFIALSLLAIRLNVRRNRGDDSPC